MITIKNDGPLAVTGVFGVTAKFKRGSTLFCSGGNAVGQTIQPDAVVDKIINLISLSSGGQCQLSAGNYQLTVDLDVMTSYNPDTNKITETDDINLKSFGVTCTEGTDGVDCIINSG